MTRLANTVIGPVAYGIGRGMPMINLEQGATFGVMPEYAQYVSAAQYVRKNLIARLIAPPAGFKDLPNSDRWIAALKALVEMWPKTIDGLKGTYTISDEETAYGASGEMMQQVSNVMRERSEPTFGYVDLYGRPIANFFNMWTEMFLMDPQTKIPNISTLVNKPVDMLPDYVGMTVLFMEPDPTFTKIDKAFLCTNMRPTGSLAPIEGKKDPVSNGEQSEFNITFTAITQMGQGVNQFAQKILQQMNLTGANPNLRAAFLDDIAADAKAADSGIAEELARAIKDTVTPA